MQRIQELSSIFRVYDKENKGKVTRDAFKAIYREIMKTDQHAFPELTQCFALFDPQNSQEIQFNIIINYSDKVISLSLFI